MVGVARNQRCRNCRKKKKGCDLQRPVCGSCARLGIQCGYDEKEWTFVTQKPASAMMSRFRVPIRKHSLDSLTRERSPSPLTGSKQRSLSRTAFELGSLEHFWSIYLPKDDPGCTYVGGVRAAFFGRSLQDLSYFDDTAGLALSACALVTLARLNSDRSLLHQGTRLYSKALSQTNKALSNPTTAQSDAVLASCKFLAMFEVLRFYDGEGVSRRGHDWQKHVEGICKIMELRGPAKHVSDHGHVLFEDCRITAIISGITLRKPNFFTSADWHTIPWETSPRNLRDELCDVLILLPELLQQHDILLKRAETVETPEDRVELIKSGQKHMQRSLLIAKALRRWEEKLLAVCAACSSSLTTTTTPAPPAFTLLDVCKNHGYGLLNVTMQYWVGCLILAVSTRVISSRLLGSTITNPTEASGLPSWMELPEIPEWMQAQTFASNIVACTPHFFRSDAGFWGPQAAAFPIGAASLYYSATGAQNSAEMSQLRELLEASVSGKVTDDFLKSLGKIQDPANKEEGKGLEKKGSLGSRWFGTRHSEESETDGDE